MQQTWRPRVQQAWFALFRESGSKGILGRQDWVFYRPDLRYLVEPDQPEPDNLDTVWVTPNRGLTRRTSVIQAIIRFRDQLAERGIKLLVVPVPGKASIYPDQLTTRLAGTNGAIQSPTRLLLAALDQRQVATVDLFAIFANARTDRGDPTGHAALYLARDTHWTPLGCRLAALAITRRLAELGWLPPQSREFKSTVRPVRRTGDILEMLQIPGLAERFRPEIVECDQVSDPALGLLVPSNSDRPGTYRFPVPNTSVLLLGDSFSRIYQFPEPASLGDLRPGPTGITNTGPAHSGGKRLLPGSAGLVSQLALAFKAPVDAIVSDGGASTDVRKKLSMNPEILEGKKVVIWEFVERDIALGGQGWEPAPLPARL